MIKIKNLLISQPEPGEAEKSPFKILSEKYGLRTVYKKLIKVVGVPAKDFRQERVNFLDYTAVIFTSRNAVDYYFFMAKELRLTIPVSMKYFCSSETTAFYLQNYIQYRKRKIFYGKSSTSAGLMEIILKHKDEKFLLPCSDVCTPDLPNALEKNKIKYQKAKLFKTVSDSLVGEINIEEFDLIAFFSPFGVKSLFENFPDFVQADRAIAAFGQSTWTAAEEAGLLVNVKAPTPEAPSMAQALENYIISCQKNLQSEKRKSAKEKSETKQDDRDLLSKKTTKIAPTAAKKTSEKTSSKTQKAAQAKKKE